MRSKSDANIAESGGDAAASNPRHLKRRSSERHSKSSRKVAFEDQQATPWWNFPLKLMKGQSGTGSTRKKTRRRHYTDPESRKRIN